VKPMAATGPGAGRSDQPVALDRLIASRLPVPACGVVSATAYQAVASTPAIAELIDALRAAPSPEPQHLSHEQERVDHASLTVPVPSSIETSIVDLAREIGDGGRVAVRSSATLEDTEGASCAGQFRSILDVGPDDVIQAVRLVWASLWHPAPRSYRRARSIDESDLGMAVVVMRMVDATTAGVVFTVDPEGDESMLRIETVEGLGDKLVSGATTPEKALVPRHGRSGLDRQLADIRKLALRAESVLGAPQDVEWAAEGSRVWIVQSRPITTAAPSGTEVSSADDHDQAAGEGSTTWTPVAIEGMAPGVLTPCCGA